MIVAVALAWLASSAVNEEFQLIAAAHRDLGAFDLRIDVSIESAGSSVPLQAVLKCDGRDRCLRLFRNSITLQTPGLALMVDTNERTITVTRQPLDTRPTGTLDPATALQAWLDQGGRLSGGEITPDGRHWSFASGKPGVPTGKMYVDPNSRRLRRLAYRSDTSQGVSTTVDIRYRWGDPARLDAREFDPGRFVTEQRGVIVPVDDYALFRVIYADRR